MLRHMDFRWAGTGDGDEYKLESACCDRFWERWQGLWQAKSRNIHSAKTAANTVPSDNWALIQPHAFFLSFLSLLAFLFFHISIITFISTTQTTLSHTHTQSSLFSQIFVLKKRKKKTFVKLLCLCFMKFLFEIVLQNCYISVWMYFLLE